MTTHSTLDWRLDCGSKRDFALGETKDGKQPELRCETGDTTDSRQFLLFLQSLVQQLEISFETRDDTINLQNSELTVTLSNSCDSKTEQSLL